MNFTNNNTRGALLISAPGDGAHSKYLPGVGKDISNMRQFLQSSKGGSWLREEIIELENPSIYDLKLKLNQLSADYVFVYFSGHGLTSLQNNRMIALKDGLISDVELLNHSQRQLVIIDACRNHGGSGLSGLQIADHAVSHYDGLTTYDYFSEQIAISPYGKMIVHATQAGMSSYDNSIAGGFFTNALLRVSYRMKSSSDYAPCVIQDVLHHIPGVIKKNGVSQIPAIVYRTGDLRVPFALSMTSREVELLLQKKKDQDTINDLVRIAAVTILLVCVVAAASN